MPRFRKKPVVIEAAQFLATKQSFDEILRLGVRNWRAGEMGADCFYIETLEGDMKVSDGDWVIKGVRGEFYPCKPDIFEATYEEAK